MGWARATPNRLEETELASDGQLTVAGALFLVSDATSVLGRPYVEVRRFTSDAAYDYDRRDEIRGPVHHVLVEAIDVVARELGTELVVIGARRFDLPRLPEVVLREAIANALAHRSYEASGTPVLVELRPSAVIVRSPGGLPEPVTVNNIRETMAARNHAVITVLRRLGLAEDAGRGVDVMLDRMADEMLDPPRFTDLGHEVRVELPLHSPVSTVERAWLLELERRTTIVAADRLVLVHAARGEELTNGRVREILGVDALAARDALQRLRDEGFLEQRGTRGGATYRLAGSLTPPSGLRLSSSELDAVVEELARAQPIRNADVRAATGLDRAQALALLDRLVASGRLVRAGERRGTTYSLR